MPYSPDCPELDGVRWKLRRAVDHFRDIDVAVGQFFREQSKAAGHKFDNDGKELVVTLPNQPIFDPRFPLLIGDCIHNIRSALDHLVGQLAKADPTALEKTAFPIYVKPDNFKAFKGKISPYISCDALAELERLQPYSAGDGDKNILWVLHRLDIIDKHRLLIVAKHKVRAAAFRIFTDSGMEASHVFSPDSPWKTSEDGAEILRFSGLPPQTKLHMELHAEGSIQIEQTGLVCDGENLIMVLQEFIEYAGGLVDYFGRTFFGA